MKTNVQQITTDKISDGYHTFGELYEHRRALTIALIRAKPEICWRTKHHHPDDAQPMFDNCFLIGIDLPTGQIRYHYYLEHWDKFEGIRELPHADLWDGSSETVNRLESLSLNW